MESSPTSHSSVRGAKTQAKKPSKKRTSASSPRINSLAMPRYLSEKYVKPVHSAQSGVSPRALTANTSARIEHLSIPPLRTLIVNKQIYSRLPTAGPEYEDRLDKMIQRSWNSMYNCYKKARNEDEEMEEQDEANQEGNYSTRTLKDKTTRYGKMVW